METSPPSYASSSPTPIYSYEPGQDEQRLLYRDRTTDSGSRPTGIFVQKHKGITIVLNDQEDGAQRPVYGRRANISGTLVLDGSEFLSDVSIQIIGHLEVLSTTQGYISVDIVNESYTLFNSDASSSANSCPASLSFNITLPTFVQKSNEYLLPPSYYILLPGDGTTGAQYVKCTYSLKAITSKIRSARAAFLGKSHKSIHVEFEYLPRSRPPRPIPQRLSFSKIKACPEEWRAFTYGIVPQPKSNLAPVSCQVFLPAVGVFGVADSIPFYIQLSGPRSTLEKLQQDTNDKSPPLRVYLLRQLVIQANGRKHPARFHLGEGKPCAQPSVVTDDEPSKHNPSNDNESIAWEGEVRCELEENLSPSFDIGVVSTMDFVTVEISKRYRNLFLPFRQAHAVRLVTDPCKGTVVP